MTPGGLVYHILNRSMAGLPLFRKRADYEAFERNRTCVARSRPYGSEEWQNRQADDLGWWHTLRREGDGEGDGEADEPQTEAELEAIRRCVARGQPCGGEPWFRRTAQQLGSESTLRAPHQPRKRQPN